jgi:hypothetical protein
MVRQLLIVVTLVGLFVATVTGTLAADNVTHTTIPYSALYTLPLGPLAGCFGGPGTVTIEANGILTVTRFIDGPNAGDTHILGKATDAFTVVTTDGRTFTGTFQELYNFQYASGQLPDSPPRVGAFHYQATGVNTATGEALRFTFHGHIVLDRDGMPQVNFSKVNCSK